MELGRFRDLSRIYLLIVGAFSVVFFVRWVMIGYLTGGVSRAVLCGAVLFGFLIFGALMLYFGLERWDRFYTDLTVPQPPQPYVIHFQPVYYPQPYYYAPPAYPPPAYPPPAYPPPAYQYPRPPHAPPPVYHYAQQYHWPSQGIPAYPAPRPFPDHVGPQRYYHRFPQPRRELDPRRALILPEAMKLLVIFLLAVFVGGVALAVAPYTALLSLIVFLPAFVIGFSFPSLIWISYVYSFETAHRLPSKVVLKAFVYGMLSTIPALLVNTLAAAALGEGPGASLAVILVLAAVVAPFVEEFSKPWGVFLVKEEVRGRLDGLIFGVTCGVGFALIENITYEFSFVLTGEGAAAIWTLFTLARGLGSIMVHAAGAGLIGYAYGRYRAGGGWTGVPLAYLAAVGLHAAWNGLSTVFATVDWGVYASVGFMVFFVAGTFLLVRGLIDRGVESEGGPARQAAGPGSP